MNIYCKISSHPDNVYYVAPGVPFSSNASEELDSSSVVLKHVKNDKRLTNIKPYDWICFYTDEACTQRLSIDKDENNNPIFIPRMLVNSFYEKEINIFEHIFEYTITCMSETKLLEKIQLPNRQWMTKSDGTKKTVAQVIDEVMQLYIPKVKVRNNEDEFIYDYIIHWNREYLNSRFNVELKDVSLSSPTLRQALTSLMQQCSCIPVVKDGNLTWLDFLKAEEKNFTRDSTMNYIERSLASDSYSNSLVCYGSNMLDSGNSTINEIIHFSDRNNLLLKQTSNLFLETSKPIYYVNKLKMCNWVKSPLVFINSKNPSGYPGSYFNVWASIVQANNSIVLQVNVSGGYEIINNELKIKILEYSGTFEDKTAIFLNEINETRTYNPYQTLSFDKMSETTDVVVFVTADLKMVDDIFTNVTICDLTKESPDEYRSIPIYYLAKSDMSKLCLEQSKRQLLDTDFLSMDASTPTIDELAKYFYGTVGYVKGSKEITGWSDEYTETTGWWNANYTYIENITKHLLFDEKAEIKTSLIEQKFFDSKEILVPNCFLIDTNEAEIIDSSDIAGIKTFASCWFEIEYQPLNDFTITHEKNEIELKLSQLDGSQSAITNLDSYNKAEKDKIDRIGQEVFSISQRVNDNEFNKIQKVPSVLDGEYIVFKRTVSIGKNCTNVQYSASKNAIIKNYFTSIATKYRAYAYTDYNSAVTRKENTTIYALLSKDFKYDGDEHLLFGYLPYLKSKRSVDLLSQFSPDITNLLYYGFEYGSYLSQYPDTYSYGAFKNELSITTFGTNVALNFEEFDNVSAGLKLINTNEYYKNTGEGYKTKLGGLPQGWYKWENPESDSRLIGFVSSVEPKFEDELPELDDVYNFKKSVFETPLITQYANVPYAKVDSQIILYDNPLTYEKYLYKDQSEIINQTLQISYYTDDKNVIFGDLFTDMICWKGKNIYIRLLKLVEGHTISEMPKFNSEKHGYSADFESDYIISCCQVLASGNNVGVRVDYNKAIHCNGRYYLRFIYLEQAPYWRDICEFSISEEEYNESYDGTHHYVTYWLTLNDTKTNKVYDMSGDIPALRYTVSSISEGQESGRDVTRQSGPKRFVLKNSEAVQLATDGTGEHRIENITFNPENFVADKWYQLDSEGLYELSDASGFEFINNKYLVVRKKDGTNYFSLLPNVPESEQFECKKLTYNETEEKWYISGEKLGKGGQWIMIIDREVPANQVDLFIKLEHFPTEGDFINDGWQGTVKGVLCMSVDKYGDIRYQ